MERITRKMLTSRVDLLNRILNRPATAWTRIPKNTKFKALVMTSNDGHFMLSTYSPGDGWTRYTLSVIVGEKGGEHNVSPGCTASEMWTYLRGVFDAVDSFCYADGGKHTFSKWEQGSEAQNSIETNAANVVINNPKLLKDALSNVESTTPTRKTRKGKVALRGSQLVSVDKGSAA